MCTVLVMVVTGSNSTFGGEYSFSSNGFLFGGVGALDLSLCLVWCLGAAGMLTTCGFILRDVQVLLYFCSTFLVCVLVVSSVVFAVIWIWEMFASFLIASIFMCLKVQTRRLVLDFSLH